MPQVPLATRLKTYGINATTVQPPDLNVPANQQMVLQINDQSLSSHAVKIVPKSLDDLKNWVGIPNAAFANISAASPTTHLQPVLQPVVSSASRLPTLTHLQPVLQPVLPVHEKYTPKEDATLRQLASSYVYGHTSAVSASQLPALNKWISVVAPWFWVILFNDITVGSGATLVVNHTILFAHNITVNKNGLIRMKYTKSRIDCAGIKCL